MKWQIWNGIEGKRENYETRKVAEARFWELYEKNPRGFFTLDDPTRPHHAQKVLGSDCSGVVVHGSYRVIRHERGLYVVEREGVEVSRHMSYDDAHAAREELYADTPMGAYEIRIEG